MTLEAFKEWAKDKRITKLDVALHDEGARAFGEKILGMTVREMLVDLTKANFEDAIIELDLGEVCVTLNVHVVHEQDES